MAWIAVWYGNKFSMGLMGIGTDGYFGRFGVEVLSGMAMGVAFVYAGVSVAPGKNKSIVYFISGLAFLIAVIGIFFAIYYKNWWAVLSGASMGFGALVAMKQFFSDMCINGETP